MKWRKFIVCGVPRAWKSTLARKIARQLWCSHIPLDPLMTSFHRIYPETWITLSMKCDMSEYFRICKTTTHFLSMYISSLDKELDSYVIEWFHMDIDMLVEQFWETHTIVVVWYPHVTSDQKLRAIRRYDTSDIHRTYVLDQTELVKQVEWFIELSNIFYTKAEELGVDFVDTSFDYEKVIEEFLRNMGWDIFNLRNEEKKILDISASRNIYINEREIWYVKLWKNIWWEQNWRKWFMRPFLVIKRVGNLFRWVPLTSWWKDNKWYYELPHTCIYLKKDYKIHMRLCLSQAKVLDSKRFIRHIWDITPEILYHIKKLLQNIYL